MVTVPAALAGLVHGPDDHVVDAGQGQEADIAPGLTDIHKGQHLVQALNDTAAGEHDQDGKIQRRHKQQGKHQAEQKAQGSLETLAALQIADGLLQGADGGGGRGQQDDDAGRHHGGAVIGRDVIQKILQKADGLRRHDAAGKAQHPHGLVIAVAQKGIQADDQGEKGHGQVIGESRRSPLQPAAGIDP